MSVSYAQCINSLKREWTLTEKEGGQKNSRVWNINLVLQSSHLQNDATEFLV